MSTICLQLGNAAANDTSSYSQTVSAKTADEIASSKNGLVKSSLERLDVFVDGSELGTIYNPMELATWAPFLSPSSVVSIRVQGANSGKIDLQPINTSFLLAGLIGASERREPDGSRILTATKRKFAPKVSAAPLRKKKNVVTLNLDNFGMGDDDDADMIDEDGLLEDEMLAPPPALNAQSAKEDDCAGRKPCDNCSCGRAEVYAAEQAAGADSRPEPKAAVPSSACGKCNLGDAFRCASCPFLGKPAFKAGEEHVVLQMTDDL
eukprot:CAMPEP_0116137434 /NCGR_PEP_ID=MMETSP0329-20121206/12246_1 /TAXON_ID=697910 /ORGANISM="Pseudo-nitzschia arenysensis, Strain B593" /LENGTH=263 /DNA_ID=CAMNT_0003632349 /DNA_START=95 /DNA_END=886 /DNA_ORIENTATION=-